MSEIVAIVEGQTEQTFVRDHLASHLGALGMSIWPVLSGKARRQGGVRPWGSALGDILRTLKEGRYVTTMFDLYAMPTDWPGREESKTLPFREKGDCVEARLAQAVAQTVGNSFDARQFIPYVQVHEFEALLFSDTEKMAQTLSVVSRRGLPQLGTDFRQILEAAGEAEAINDTYENCPSRRIAALVPAYRKPIYGPMIAGAIGMDALRAKCPHFGQWLDRLEALSR